MQRNRIDDNIITAITRKVRRRHRRRVAEAIGGILATALTGALIAWVLVNWVTGCGEVFHTVDGTIMGECVLMPWRD